MKRAFKYLALAFLASIVVFFCLSSYFYHRHKDALDAIALDLARVDRLLLNMVVLADGDDGKFSKTKHEVDLATELTFYMKEKIERANGDAIGAMLFAGIGGDIDKKTCFIAGWRRVVTVLLRADKGSFTIKAGSPVFTDKELEVKYNAGVARAKACFSS